MQKELSKGAGAALALQLSDARRDLATAIAERNGHMEQAAVYRALAAEADNSHLRAGRNSQCVKYQLRAAGLDGAIADMRARVAQLEAAANGTALPVVLSSEQLAAVDDTAGLVAA